MKSLPGRTVIGVAGLVLVVGFFLPWLDAGVGSGIRISASGYGAFANMTEWSIARLMMLVVPLGGLAMMGTAAANSPRMRHASFFTGLSLVGYAAYKFVSVTGWGLWLVMLAAVAALIAPLLAQKKS